MGVNDVDPTVPEEPSESRNLNDRIPIVEACQRVLVNFAEPDPVSLLAQHTLCVHAGDVDVVAAVLMEQPRQLNGLTLGTSLIKTADEL